MTRAVGVCGSDGGKIGIGRHEKEAAEEAELEVLHGVPVAVVEIGADEVGLPLVGVVARAPWSSAPLRR